MKDTCKRPGIQGVVFVRPDSGVAGMEVKSRAERDGNKAQRGRMRIKGIWYKMRGGGVGGGGEWGRGGGRAGWAGV